jgi:hypothetical protein
MPATVRAESKARKIAWSILGVPANIASKRSKRDEEINLRLVRDETVRVR